LVLAPLLLLLAGCASKQTAPAQGKPGDGIAEYRQIAVDAERALGEALGALASVQAESNVCSPPVLAAFSTEVQQVQVESLQIRARSQAMQARGDAYFAHWHENLTTVADPQVRARIESRRPQLEESFRRIKALSQEGREAFQPFLADLRPLRNRLEKDPASLGTDTVQELVRRAAENGRRVQNRIAGVARELDSMRAMLFPEAQSGN
jgi:hypothetical protein